MTLACGALGGRRKRRKEKKKKSERLDLPYVGFACPLPSWGGSEVTLVYEGNAPHQSKTSTAVIPPLTLPLSFPFLVEGKRPNNKKKKNDKMTKEEEYSRFHLLSDTMFSP